MIPEVQKHFILHHSDSDGACAAAVFKMHPDWKEAEVRAVTYGYPFPNDIILDKNTHIAIVDFSYDRKTITDVNSKVASLIVLDHHDGSEKELAGLPYVKFPTQSGHAGAGMTWHYLFPEIEPPMVVQLVDDYDLWIHQYPQSKQLETAVRWSGKFMEMEYWHELINNQSFAKAEIERGRIIYDHVRQNAKDIVEKKQYTIVDLPLTSGKLKHVAATIAFVNTTHYVNDIAEAIYQARDDIDMVMYYHVRPSDGKLKLGFRSRHDKDLSCSYVASLLGGNGRKNTAGVVLGRQEGFDFLNDLFKGAQES